jgi:putative ABC transport system ATP-binding protein
VEGLTKVYGGGERARAVLRQLDAEIDRGEYLAVRGRSGSGKTTLLNLLAGIDEPSEGEIHFAGQPLSELSSRARTVFRRDHVGFVFQFFNLIPTLTVEENVLLPAELAGSVRPAASSRALELLDEVGLRDRRASFPDQLSGGEQQRIAIARALLLNPSVILADEPTGNLDRATGEQVLALLNAMRLEAGSTLILVTHSRRIAASADRVLTIEHGQLVPDPEFDGK